MYNVLGVGILMMICIFSCLCPSVFTRIISALLFQAYTINWVILLIFLYAGIMLVQMTWYGTQMSCHYQCCISGAMHNILSNGNHKNDNNTTVASSSLLVDAVALAVALPWIWYIYTRYQWHGNNYKYLYSP